MSPPATERTDHNYRRATIWMVAATFSFAGMSALIKRHADFPTSQLMFFRSAIALLATFLFLLSRRQVGRLVTNRPWVHLLRGLFGVAAMGCSFTALQEIPLALASALIHTKALFIAPLAALILREHLYGRRLALTIFGFAGVAIMLNPSAPDISPGSIFGLLAAGLASLAMICVRSLGRTESSIAIVFYFMLCATSVSGVLCVFQWTPVTSIADLLVLSAIGLSGVLGQTCMVIAYRSAEASFVAPLDYIQLVWTALLGFIFWSEVPTWWLICGACIVAISQILMQHHAKGIRARVLAESNRPPA